MSYDYSKRVWATNLKGGKLLVMLALAQHADKQGECYPSADTLAAMARLTDRQVRRVLNTLEKSGHVAIEERAIGRGKRPHYKLFPDEKADILSDQQEKAEEMSGLKAEEMPDQSDKADKMSTIAQESGQNVHLTNGKADIPDKKSGHFGTEKADISEPIQSHARSESHLELPIELTEKEETHAHDPLSVAWRQVYADVALPPVLEKSLQSLVAECGMAAAIHGIKASAAKEDGRNFRYIAECARNYVPPAPVASYSNGHSNGYSIDIPGVVALPAAPKAPAPLPPPMPHDDPWKIAVAELTPVFANSSAARWLEGSRLEENGELAGVPFYRVVLTTVGANAQWMTQQAEPAIRKKLAGLLGKRIAIEIVAEREPA